MQAENALDFAAEHDMNICNRWWFQAIEKLQRPVWRWAMGVPPLIYAWRGSLGADFSEGIFLAMCIPPGAAYVQRGVEKLKEMEMDK